MDINFKFKDTGEKFSIDDEQIQEISSENNMAQIAGAIVGDKTFSHEIYGEKFYSLILNVPRLSNFRDEIPITISEKLMLLDEIKDDDKLKVKGQYRSYNNFSKVGNRLLLTLFAKSVEKDFSIEKPEDKNLNMIYLNGYICKPPVYRTTPFGREITDILLAVNRIHNKSDYIPCIVWGRNAKFAQNLNVGDNVRVWGRIQSRKYQKRISEQEVEIRVAYEVSVSKINLF